MELENLIGSLQIAFYGSMKRFMTIPNDDVYPDLIPTVIAPEDEADLSSLNIAPASWWCSVEVYVSLN